MPSTQSREPMQGSKKMGGNQPHHFKLVLLGDASVGKSCLVVRFAKEEFYEHQEPTIGAAFMTQTVDLDRSTTVKFEIWDTAGQERESIWYRPPYRSLAPMYYRGAAAAVIVYDVTSRESFDGARSWVTELQGISSQENLVITSQNTRHIGRRFFLLALCGNKADLVGDKQDFPRQVETDVARAYAQEMGILFLETSAKTGQNVKEVFHQIAQRLPLNPKNAKNTGGVDISKKGGASTMGGC